MVGINRVRVTELYEGTGRRKSLVARPDKGSDGNFVIVKNNICLDY